MKEDIRYIRKTASDTIARGLRFVYGGSESGFSFFQDVVSELTELDFFKGLASYLFMEEDDDRAGEKMVWEKVRRMLEKVEDPEESYTFDVFEELLFYMAIMCCRDHLRFYKRNSQVYDMERERGTVSELMEKYHYPKTKAARIGRAVCRFHEMSLKEDEDDNMFFWDDDYAFIFQNGFIEGIRFLKSAVGENQGYGYEYACGIFTDIGLKAPLRLLGTKEANRIANELTMQKIRSSMDQTIPPVGGRKEYEDEKE